CVALRIGDWRGRAGAVGDSCPRTRIESLSVFPFITGYNCSEIDWVQWAASCYLLSEKEKTWQESIHACAAMLASLVKRDTQEELVQSHLRFSSLLRLVPIAK
uniref:Uncharacterized protein n=1 Tax=Chrysemys picta bellii TaxID=8478 RepID=A0A8C3FBA3_CHRPI